MLVTHSPTTSISLHTHTHFNKSLITNSHCVAPMRSSFPSWSPSSKYLHSAHIVARSLLSIGGVHPQRRRNPNDLPVGGDRVWWPNIARVYLVLSGLSSIPTKVGRRMLEYWSARPPPIVIIPFTIYVDKLYRKKVPMWRIVVRQSFDHYY